MATVAVSTAAAAATESSGSASSTGTSVVAVPTVSGTTPVAAGASKLGSRIVYSAAGVEIVCRPYLVCEELEKLSQESSQDFIASLDHSKIVNPVSVEILNGGHYYFVKPAYEKVTGKPCRLATLRAKRFQDKDTKQWKVRMWEQKGNFLDGTVLIGDTVATGTTLCGVLEFIAGEMDKASKWNDIFVFAIAGATKGEPMFQKVHNKLAAHGKALTIVYANAQFNLADNGTDLGFTGAAYDAKSKELIDTTIGDFADSMKCAVWDWGDRFRLPHEHLEDIKGYFDGVKDAPEWLLKGINERLPKYPKEADAHDAAAAAAGADDSAAGAGGGAGAAEAAT